jgi:hypothetical protein
MAASAVTNGKACTCTATIAVAFFGLKLVCEKADEEAA